jgi:predicted outer membrane protein
VVSLSSSDLVHALRRALALVALALTASAVAPGCVLVRPEEREILADESMTFGAEGEAAAQEDHVISNREGSYGAGAVTGGGCGCN